MENIEKTKCLHCGSSLRSINDDWNSRKYHKKCFNEIQNKESTTGFHAYLLSVNPSLNIKQIKKGLSVKFGSD